MATLEAIVAQIQTVCGAVSGIKKAPALPPENIPAGMFPFVIAYPDTGEISQLTTEEGIVLCKVIIELHVGRRDLALDTDKLYPYFETLPDAILSDPTLSSTADTMGGMSWEFGELNWGDAQTLGVRFTINDLKYKLDLS